MQELYSKGVAIIESCKTPRQLATAQKWVRRLRANGFDELADCLITHIYLKDSVEGPL